MNKPEVLRRGLLSIQVCVPKEFNDEQVKEFADLNNPAGTTHGWQIRKEGSESLAGDPERRQCAERTECVHIMLDC